VWAPQPPGAEWETNDSLVPPALAHARGAMFVPPPPGWPKPRGAGFETFREPDGIALQYNRFSPRWGGPAVGGFETTLVLE